MRMRLLASPNSAALVKYLKARGNPPWLQLTFPYASMQLDRFFYRFIIFMSPLTCDYGAGWRKD
jgi:hypothetical protein